MQHRNLGNRTVSAIGIGGMPMSIEGRPDRARSIATIHAALDHEVTFIDTANCYHLFGEDYGHNELIVADALRSYSGSRDNILVATKGGRKRLPDGTMAFEGRPEQLAAAARASAKRLGVDTIDLYQYHRPDPTVPYAESVGALRDLLDDGIIAMAGISNANPSQIREAHQVLGGRLASVQNQFSPVFRSSLPEMDLCEQLGVAFLPWSPLGGIARARSGELGDQYAPFIDIAQAHGVSPFQVTLAWELALANVVIPIPGASRPESIIDSAAAAGLTLTPDEITRLSQTTPQI
ncbi:MAG: aldo/keto reductase [Cellulomonadaceae bacterium]|jgi:aryl-alcohol dehydrogenase-like predicted oxidoreductase|nr:aldo/keto reductase [Cellulomonadaceae bacterium]